MTDPRIDVPFVGSERELLETFLEWHRQTLAYKCAGLTDEQLRERSVPPSGMSLLGLVRHLADVERAWTRRTLLGEDAPPLHWTEERRDDDFDALESTTRDQAFAAWEAEAAYSREVAAKLPLDTIAKQKRHGHKVSLRWILIHLIEEYARHNGHADLLRERIDGQVGE